MATTAWMFEECPDAVEFKDLPDPHPTKVLKRIMRSFVAHRIITNATQMPATAAGTLATGTPQASIGSANVQGAAIQGLKWVCVSNVTKMQGVCGTNALRQTQRWVTFTPWTEFDLEEA